MNNQQEINVDGFFDNLVSSYETRIQKIQTAFQASEHISESSHSLFDNVHNSITELKKERDILNSKLCETLAKNGSLRKKDYNTMMSGILSTLDDKEREAESQFLAFIESQKETTQSLKNSILDMKDLTSPDGVKIITNVKEQLSQIAKQQEIRKDTVMKTFLDFHQMHNRMMECLEDLIKKGDHIQNQDLKKIKDLIIQ
ncbi:MAG: hypothetical protein WCR42_01830 [bacterium]